MSFVSYERGSGGSWHMAWRSSLNAIWMLKGQEVSFIRGGASGVARQFGEELLLSLQDEKTI